MSFLSRFRSSHFYAHAAEKLKIHRVRSVFPLPIPLVLPHLKPRDCFVLKFGWPFEGSGWSKFGFGFFSQIFLWCLLNTGRVPCTGFAGVTHLFCIKHYTG
jgi:hypothetical protein